MLTFLGMSPHMLRQSRSFREMLLAYLALKRSMARVTLGTTSGVHIKHGL